MANSDLNRAKMDKEDEFYTQLKDIENEMRHYRGHFKGKTVFCNCDDPFESNFFKYFVLNFNRLGLKKLIATCYAGSPIAYKQLTISDFNESATCHAPTRGGGRVAYKAIVNTVYDKTGNGEVGLDDVKELFKSGENTLEELVGNGDFRSSECLSLLNQADIVVTNPPFSLFREYLALLMKYNKCFIIIGPQNAIKYKDIFPFMMNNQIWLGSSSPKDFIVPSADRERKNIIERDDGTFVASFGNVCWFTNLDLKKRHEKMILIQKYNPESYPHYANFDGIDVSNINDIPCDYPGIMGVPITFMEYYNPEQFVLLGTSTGNLAKQLGISKNHRGRTDVFYYDKDGKPKCPYQRLFIRNLEPELQDVDS